MTGPPSIRNEHALAIRLVNARFAALPLALQEKIQIGHDTLEVEVDAAIVAEDRERALAAIGAWRRHWIAIFEEAAK